MLESHLSQRWKHREDEILISPEARFTSATKLKRELEEGQAFGNDIIQGLQEEQTQGIGMTNSTQSVFRI